MATVAVIGIGRVGLAALKILSNRYPEYELVAIDASLSAESTIFDALPEDAVVFYHASTKDYIENVLVHHQVNAVLCSTPFKVNIQIAELCAKHGIHYLDFTEDVGVTDVITQLAPTDVTFVPQTGLAPGLVGYIGLWLVDSLQAAPLSLDLRVGALTPTAFGPSFYERTWSTDGLVNEYLKPARVKIDGKLVEIPSLSGHRELMIDCHRFEEFATSGGVGDISAYEHIPNVCYKTLRYPGHRDWFLSLHNKIGGDHEKLVEAIERETSTTRDDVVVLLASAVDEEKRRKSVSAFFYPNSSIDLTALELTTAGTACGVLQLLLEGVLPKGVLTPKDIKLVDLRFTRAYTLISETASFHNK